MSRNPRSNLISIEPLQRRLIQEFTMDGQEIYEEKLSLSEQLSRNVQRLDFSRDLDAGVYQSEDGQLAEEERDRTKNLVAEMNQAKTAFEAPRESLRKAFFEISILSDLLMVLNKCPRYLQLKEAKTQSPFERKTLPHKCATPGKSLIKAREALKSAAEILLRGANELTSCLGARNGSEHAFHDCLWSLRERWRLVRSQDSIMGDLTYHSVGSRIDQKARFIVRKSADVKPRGVSDGTDVDMSEAPLCPVSLDIPQELLTRSALLVYLHSEPIRRYPELNWDKLELEGSYGLCPPADLPEWQLQLYKAQLSFFHWELFSQLMIDAYSPEHERPVYVCDGQLHVQLRPGRWMSLHCVKENDIRNKQTESNTEPILEPNRALYLFACDCLRQLHRHTEQVARPAPATAQFLPIGARLEGPTAAYVPPVLDSFTSRSKQTTSSVQQISNFRLSQEQSVLSKLQEGILRIDLINFILTTCRTVNSELKPTQIRTELEFPLDAFPAQLRIPILEKFTQTDLCSLKLEPRTGTMHNIVPIGTGENSVQFSVDSPRFLVYIRRTILLFWMQRVIQYFAQDPDWIMTSLSPLQPFLPDIQLKSVVSFQHKLSARVTQVSLTYPNQFLVSSGFELTSDNFDCLNLERFKGDNFQDKLLDYFNSLM